MQHNGDHTTSVGTTAGTVLTVFANIGSQDYIKTIVLAIIGAVVSFCVSWLLKWLTRKGRK
jgi:uncharacterized membrane protein YeaQ/YmgE (transglycosylase-associated protein family)